MAPLPSVTLLTVPTAHQVVMATSDTTPDAKQVVQNTQQVVMDMVQVAMNTTIVPRPLSTQSSISRLRTSTPWLPLRTPSTTDTDQHQ